MKRYYLANIAYNDDFGFHAEGLVNVQGINSNAVLPPNPELGGTCLVIVAARNHVDMLGDQKYDVLPEFPQSARMSAMAPPAVQALTHALSRRNIDVAWAQSEGWNEVLRRIGRTINAGFHEAAFDIPDVS